MPIDADAVASAFGLGRPTGEPTWAARGELGIIWHLLTERGEWAVKELLDPGQEFGADLELQLAARAAGLPLPAPVLAGRGEAVVRAGGTAVRVYEWVDLDPDRSCPPDQAGKLLAGIHRLGVAPGPPHWFYFRALGDDGWSRLARRAEAARPAAWAARLGELLEDLRRTEDGWVSGQPPGPGAVQGHMDFNRDNVRVQRDGRPVILDWENASATDPAEEVAMAAVEFLAGRRTEADQHSGLSAAVALVGGYREAGGRFAPTGPDVFAMAFVCQAHLLDLFSERACDATGPPEQRIRAAGALDDMTAHLLTSALAEALLGLWTA